MSGMQDIQTLAELGQAVRTARLAAQLTTVEVARDSGRSRDVLHRLESGQDVSASSLLAILAAIGRRLELASVTRPTLSDMQRRFEHLQDEAESSRADEAPAATKRSRGRR
jgi:HTH-type transcriptional regulator / antitoxin HipB